MLCRLVNSSGDIKIKAKMGQNYYRNFTMRGLNVVEPSVVLSNY